jgi:hypothetical protein
VSWKHPAAEWLERAPEMAAKRYRQIVGDMVARSKAFRERPYQGFELDMAWWDELSEINRLDLEALKELQSLVNEAKQERQREVGSSVAEK